jgi:hypothetical protein
MQSAPAVRLFVLSLVAASFLVAAPPAAFADPVLTDRCSGQGVVPEAGVVTDTCTFRSAGVLVPTRSRLLINGAMVLQCRPNCVPDTAHMLLRVFYGSRFLLGCKDENREAGGVDCVNTGIGLRLPPGTPLTCEFQGDGAPGDSYSFSCRSVLNVLPPAPRR